MLLLRLNNWFLTLYLIESFDEITGIDALFVLSDLINLFNSLIVKFGLAASWISTLVGLYFLINLSPINDEQLFYNTCLRTKQKI